MEVICMEYKKQMNQETWLDCIKTNKKVKFTDTFIKMVKDQDIFKHLAIEGVFSTTEMHKLKCDICDILDVQQYQTNAQLAIVQTMMRTDTKFAIIEEVNV